jgi:signal transduction histidine kinase
MARIDQNDARRGLSNPKTGQQSLKRRLLVRIGILFAITWVTATVSTKYLSKAGTRDFLYQHTRHLAKSWIDILSQQEVSGVALSNQSSQLLNGWINNDIVITQGPFQLPKPQKTETYIHQQGDIKWIISTECESNICVLIGFRDEERRHAARRLVALISLPLLFIFLTTAVGIYYAIQSGLRPLNRLAEKVSTSHIDDLELIQEEKSTKELHPLVYALNQLIINMKNQLLKERQFLDTCAHELRTPVTALVAQIQSIGFTDKTAQTRFDNIHSAALRTVRVANQFLTLAKSNNAQALSVESEQFDLCESIRQIAINIISQKANTDLLLEGDKSIIINADSFAIEMVFQNLIENALRHGANNNNENSIILITCHQAKDTTHIDIEDNGSGVKKEHREKLTERFYRAPGSHSEGAGLGLSIVSEVVNRYNGNIYIDHSKRLGGFKISIDLKGIAENTAE